MTTQKLLWIWPLATAATVAMASGQTRLDLGTQSKNVDFSSASATKPLKAGNTNPSTCLQGEMFFNLSAIPGQNLYLCTANNVWVQLTTTSSGGGGGGATPTSFGGLTDLAVTQTGARVLTIGQSCTLAAPCNLRFGSRTYPVINRVTATLDPNPNNSGMVFIYAALQGGQPVITVGSTMTVTASCTVPSNCAVAAGIGQFPADSIPLATWTSTQGVFDVTGLTDLRAFQSQKSVIGGIGIITADVLGQTIVSADTAVFAVRVNVPANATSVCQQGNYAMDGSFFYQCTADNTWRRVAITAW